MPRDLEKLREMAREYDGDGSFYARELLAALPVIERMFERVVSHEDCDCKDCVVMREWAFSEEAEKR